MITTDKLKEANDLINAIDIKGKKYALVSDRVRAFREVCPGGKITTEIVTMEDGVVVMQATITDDNGDIVATGIASEREGSTMINKTSYIENCETSAVGRALGFAGFGIDASIASAEEVATAIVNQGEKKEEPTPMATERQIAYIKRIATTGDMQAFVRQKVKTWESLTMAEATAIIGELKAWNARQG